MKRVTLAIVFLSALMVSVNALAANPRVMNYQAVLSLSGSPVVTPVEVTFRIYDDSTGGAVLWSDTRMVTPDAAGRINELLGQNTAMDEAVFSGDNRYLSVQITGDSEMSPRQRLAASPYAFKVGTIDGAKGGKVTGSIDVTSSALATASAVEAQITLTGLGGDTVVIGPAHQAAFRAVNSAGEEVASVTMDPVEGGKVSVRVDGTSEAVHSATSSTYYTNAASPQKGPNAQAKLAEVGANGVVIYNPVTGEVVAKVDPSTGQVATTSLNVGPSPGVAANKSVAACGDNNSSDLGPVGSNNNAVGSDNNLSAATNSFSVGTCNILEAARGTALGQRNHITLDDGFASGADNVVGAERSVAFGNNNTVFGGGDNIIFGDNSFMESGGDMVIGGGYSDTIRYANDGVIAGGTFNKIEGTSAPFNANFYSTIGGGNTNHIDVSTDGFPNPGRAVIAGGDNNTITRTYGVIGGGHLNVVSGQQATVAGGGSNNASGAGAFIGGGDAHEASGLNSVVAGGGQNGNFPERNRATGTASAVGGGRRNYATGNHSVVPGGNSNEANGNYSLAAGRNAKANHSGTFVWADSTPSNFTSTGGNQFLIRAGGGVGINTAAPTQPLEVAGTIYSSSGGFKFPDGSVQSSAAASVTDGWTDDGGTVRLSTAGDNVGIGTASPAEKLDVVGNIHASGTITSGSSIHIDGTTGEISSTLGNLALIPDIPGHPAQQVQIMADASNVTMMVVDGTGKVTEVSAGGLVMFDTVNTDKEASLSPGMLVLFDTVNVDRTEFTSDGISMIVGPFDDTTIVIANAGVSMRPPVTLGGNGTDGHLEVKNSVGNTTVKFNTVNVDLAPPVTFGGTSMGTDGQMEVQNSSGTAIVKMAAAIPEIPGLVVNDADDGSALFRVNSTGSKGATFLDESGNPVVDFILGEDTAFVPGAVFHQTDNVHELISMTMKGSSKGTTFYNNSGVKITQIALGPPGEVFFDGNGTARMAYDQTNANLTFSNTGGARTIQIQSGGNSLATGTIAFSDPANSDHILMSVGPSGLANDSTGGSPFEMQGVGGFNLYSNIGHSLGVQLAANGTAWASLSDRNAKHDIHEVDSRELLEKLSAIPVSTWSYKDDESGTRHIGPMAQDFYSAFGVGEDDRHITTLDADGVALAAIKALYEKQRELDGKAVEVEELQARVTALEQLIAKIASER